MSTSTPVVGANASLHCLSREEEEEVRDPEVKLHNKKIAGKSAPWNQLLGYPLIVFIIKTSVLGLGPCTSAVMDEYEELFGREDDFEEQFADELDALAEMESESTCS